MTSRLRLGRMPRWQRRSTYVVLGACAASGIVWFALLDWFHATPNVARPWWIAHGLTALVAAMAIGASAAQHVVVTWRAARSRWAGGINLALLLGLIATALYLMYGPEAGHDTAHWVHSIVGIVAVVGFVWHVLWGRTRVPRVYGHGHHAKRPGHPASDAS